MPDRVFGGLAEVPLALPSRIGCDAVKTLNYRLPGMRYDQCRVMKALKKQLVTESERVTAP
jgi:hypothetical protein